jgi:hypothetical protein
MPNLLAYGIIIMLTSEIISDTVDAFELRVIVPSLS